MGPKKKDPVKSPPSSAKSPSASKSSRSSRNSEEEKLIGNKPSKASKGSKSSASTKSPKPGPSALKKETNFADNDDGAKPPGFWSSLFCCCCPCCDCCQCSKCSECCRRHSEEDQSEPPAAYTTEETSGAKVEFDNVIFDGRVKPIRRQTEPAVRPLLQEKATHHGTH